MQKKGKLELTWVGKYDEEKPVEPRILIEDKEKSYGDPASENMLIHGDNLIALQALQQDFAGKIKCIYIDPPYNTGYAFAQYDDGLEHSLWLSMMRSRLFLLQSLLSDEGSIWISIDGDEEAYLKVLCDEVFSRENYIATIVWQKRTSPDMRAVISDGHEYILVYAKDHDIFKKVRNKLPLSEEQAKNYSNPDDDPRGPWTSADYTAQGFRPNQMYTITTPGGKQYAPPDGKCWKNVESVFNEQVADGRIWFGSDGCGMPRRKTFLSEHEGVIPWTWWTNKEVGHTQEAKKESIKLFGANDVFDTPKPERLLQRIIHIASNEGDLVLDSFLGSATTTAVAHKMGRRWIGIELENSAYTHCKPRMDKVIDGEQGGISKAVGWQGGGGYHFYELAPSLLVKNDKLPVYQINPTYTFDMLCEAICKIEGFKYKKQDVFCGYSSEKRFIHVTTEFVNAEYIRFLSQHLDEGQSLLIYATKIQSDMILPDNIEVKKIPRDLLGKCNFESEVR
ncbi:MULTISPECIES: site-specific DNA-methyltransferase [unclassified Bilifractor]|uniref:site-specific DNA-methyltransferase n=1 Tax=unclassified Bilifractor TaxID=2815795 RepID=UPI003F902DE5